LIDLRREHLIDQVCVQEILPPENVAKRSQRRRRLDGIPHDMAGSPAIVAVTIAVSFIQNGVRARTTMPPLMQLGLFFAAMAAFVATGCILTRKPKQKLPTLQATVPDEHQHPAVSHMRN
jgi:hypothetical protein